MTDVELIAEDHADWVCDTLAHQIYVWAYIHGYKHGYKDGYDKGWKDGEKGERSKLTLKHNYVWLRKQINCVKDDLVRNVLLTSLKKSEEELQQLKQKGIDRLYTPTMIIDEVLGVKQE